MRTIVAEQLVHEAPLIEDLEHNTDLIVFRSDGVRAACRVRRSRYVAKYGNQFTVRAILPSGAPTELDKIRAGWGDLFLYGFAADGHDDAVPAGQAKLQAWVLGDLAVFRQWYAREISYGHEPGSPVHNQADGTEGRAFRIGALPSNFVKARLTADVIETALF